MASLNFRSDKHFVTSSDGTTLQVNELTNPLTHPSSIRKAYGKAISTIDTSGTPDDLDDNDEESSYNGLLCFDGHGLNKGMEALTTLARHLAQLHLLEKQHYEELMKKKDEELSKLGETNEAQREQVERLRKEKEAETKKISRMLRKKKLDDEANEKRIEELENSKEELEEKMDIKEEELQNVKKKKEELRKLLVKKDNEIRLLGKNNESQTSEFEKMLQMKDEELRAKEEELQKIKAATAVGVGDPKTVMIGAKDLRIAWGENSNHWKWRSDPDSRLGEVAELFNVWLFDVRGKIDMGTNRMLMTLPAKATYGAYFVFKMSSNPQAQGFGNQGFSVEVVVGGRNVSNGVVYLQQSGSGSRKRGDGWWEVKMGNFSTVAGRDAEGEIKDQNKYCVDFNLYNHKPTLKIGLVVYGTELRPN